MDRKMHVYKCVLQCIIRTKGAEDWKRGFLLPGIFASPVCRNYIIVYVQGMTAWNNMFYWKKCTENESESEFRKVNVNLTSKSWSILAVRGTAQT